MIDISDLGSFVSGVRKLGKNPNQTGFSSRWDLVPGNSNLTSSGWINIVDLTAVVSGASGFPPMLGGAKAMNGPAVPVPAVAPTAQTTTKRRPHSQSEFRNIP